MEQVLLHSGSTLCDLIQSVSFLSGLSDPYCMLGLMTEENEDEKTKKIKVCRKKSRTVRDVLDGDSIHMTQVKEDTLDPVWNETFTM